jgi:hypothetical protein
MAHFPKLRRGSRRRRAEAEQARQEAMESLHESLERLEELGERVEALRTRYKPWMTGVRTTSGEHPKPVTDPVPGRRSSPSLNQLGGVNAASDSEPRTYTPQRSL